MSVSIFTPQLGERIGPGYPIQVTTDLIGPIPNTATWLVSVFSTAPGSNEGPVISQQISAFAGQHTLHFTLGDLSIPLQPTDGFQVNVNTGDTVRLDVRLVNNAQVIDQTSQNQIWDAAGRLYALESPTTVTGGFTATDRNTLQATDDQTLVEMPTQASGNPVFSGGLADWLTLSHGTQYFRGPVQLLQGRGELPWVVTSRGVPFGGYFAWFTVPLELGRDDGLVPLYHRDLLQLGLVYADGGADLYYEWVRGYRFDGVFIEWPALRPPERLDYWVLPGVVVAWQFMFTRP